MFSQWAHVGALSNMARVGVVGKQPKVYSWDLTAVVKSLPARRSKRVPASVYLGLMNPLGALPAAEGQKTLRYALQARFGCK